MDYASIDINQGCQEFIEEMNKGLKGSESSLKMIPTYIAMEKEIPVKEPVIVMDAGGTNFRVAVAYFDKNKEPVIEDYNMYPMPGTAGEIGKEEFYNTIAGYLKPVLNRSNKISFCFSYPAEALPNKDGRLLHLSKEVRIKGLVGDIIGGNLFEYIKISESIE